MKFKIGDKVKTGDQICTVTKEFKVSEYNKYDLISENGVVFTRFEDEISKYKPTIDDLRDYMLEHFVNEDGNLYIAGLDFSEFSGNVYLTSIKVREDLYQNKHKVSGNLNQSDHTVGGYLIQMRHKVGGSLKQSGHKVKGGLTQSWQEVQGDYMCNGVKFGGDARVDEPQKLLKEVTKEELAELGYKLKGENE